MIQQGYLSPLISRAGRAEANLANLHIRGGEFISDEVAAAMDNDALVTSACREIVELTRDRKSVLIFTASVDHCKHVAEKIQAFSGKECAIVTGDTSPAERAEPNGLKSSPGSRGNSSRRIFSEHRSPRSSFWRMSTSLLPALMRRTRIAL